MTIESDNITIPAHDGGAFGAYFARPENCKNAPGIIVIQEIFGINSDMRAKCHELAEAGYFAVCPDLFWRIEPGVELVDSEPSQLERAFELYQQFDEEFGLADLQTALGYMRNHKLCGGKIGAIGYCLGGKLAYMMACHTGVDATVSYYGVAIETLLDQADGIKAPLLMHIAEEDEYVDPDAQQKIKSALASNPHVAIHSYPGANHAFARKNGMHYDTAAAKAADARSHDFLKTHLMGK